jgi:hypothetical protein
LIVGVAILCRFAGRMGSSSSSLRVRSMTADIRRLLDGRGTLEDAEGSREYAEVGGVLAEVPGVLWFMTEATLASLISIISSSVSFPKLPLAFDGVGGLIFVCHFPSGSIVT